MSKDDISSRKDDGINIVSKENVESKLVSTYFEYAADFLLLLRSSEIIFYRVLSTSHDVKYHNGR